MKKSIFFSALALTFFLGFIACKKDDDAPQKIEIKQLVGKQKQVIGQSTVTLDGGSPRPVASYSMEDVSGTLFIIAVLDEQAPEYVAVSTNGQAPDGQFVSGKFGGVDFIGQNFAVNEISGEKFELTGQIASAAGETKQVAIFFDGSHFGAGSSAITVEGDIAKLNGDLGSLAYNQILDLNADHPNVHTILLEIVPGSVNDEVNVETGRLIREAGYTTWVKKDSEIYSGGVDLFCSGKQRIVEDGATIGVHSWCCGSNGEGAVEIPVGDPQHNSQVSYFTEMLGDPLGKDFYFFTINAAPFDDIHEMTKAEIKQYGLATE